MPDDGDDRAAQEVAAMQFAAGRSIAEVAAEWERSAEWVEAAIRRALLAEIPVRDGGVKEPRRDERAARAALLRAAGSKQGHLWQK